MTLPVLKTRVHQPVDFYCIDYANPIPILSKSGLEVDRVTLCFITTYLVLCVGNMLSFCVQSCKTDSNYVSEILWLVLTGRLVRKSYSSVLDVYYMLILSLANISARYVKVDKLQFSFCTKKSFEKMHGDENRKLYGSIPNNDLHQAMLTGTVQGN